MESTQQSSSKMPSVAAIVLATTTLILGFCVGMLTNSSGRKSLRSDMQLAVSVPPPPMFGAPAPSPSSSSSEPLTLLASKTPLAAHPGPLAQGLAGPAAHTSGSFGAKNSPPDWATNLFRNLDRTGALNYVDYGKVPVTTPQSHFTDYGKVPVTTPNSHFTDYGKTPTLGHSSMSAFSPSVPGASFFDPMPYQYFGDLANATDSAFGIAPPAPPSFPPGLGSMLSPASPFPAAAGTLGSLVPPPPPTVASPFSSLFPSTTEATTLESPLTTAAAATTTKVKDTALTTAAVASTTTKKTSPVRAVQESTLSTREKMDAIKNLNPNQDAKQTVADMEAGLAKNKFTKRLNTFGKKWVTEKTAKLEEKEIKWASKQLENQARKEDKGLPIDGKNNKDSNNKNDKK